MTTSTSHNVPQHIAVIMDGNGRWAQQRGLPRTEGHRAGADTVHTVIEAAARVGVKFLTLYTFSTENWERPASEVSVLMQLLLQHLEEEVFMKNNIRFRVIGDMNKLSREANEALTNCIGRTAANTGLTLTLAFSYSSRWELTEAVRSIVANGVSAEEISEQSISEYLCSSYMPDPDLLIRTGGEKRISNFMLWQCAYTELYFTDIYWPDFKEEALLAAIEDYYKRERRFGKTGEQIKQ